MIKTHYNKPKLQPGDIPKPLVKILLDCPYCGGDIIGECDLVQSNGRIDKQIVCLYCDVRGPSGINTEDAKRRWNESFRFAPLGTGASERRGGKEVDILDVLKNAQKNFETFAKMEPWPAKNPLFCCAKEQLDEAIKKLFEKRSKGER